MPSLRSRLRGTLALQPSGKQEDAGSVWSSPRTHHPLLLQQLVFAGVWVCDRGQKN